MTFLFHGETPTDKLEFGHFYFCFLYSFGDRPFSLEKNLLKEGVSAKWRWSAIWVMLSTEVCNRKEASISSIWLM